jgi:hypothetical protein
MGLSDETSAINYFHLEDIEAMDLSLNHKQRILDTLIGQVAAFIR